MKILEIKTVTLPDECPDLSCLGEFNENPMEEGCVTIKHSDDPHSFSYFHAANASDDREARQDYERMLSYGNDWVMIGIRAEAKLVIGGVTQTIVSGGCWGIESDSDESYLDEVRAEEENELQGILHELTGGKS